MQPRKRWLIGLGVTQDKEPGVSILEGSLFSPLFLLLLKRYCLQVNSGSMLLTVVYCQDVEALTGSDELLNGPNDHECSQDMRMVQGTHIPGGCAPLS